MAKLQRNFVRGRMNKDLDERLVPAGEYRDAQNIQISTSEGSDVGAIENILGNTKKNFEGAGDWDDNFGLTNAICIGTTKDISTNKLYWFITSDTVDAIVEYDQATDIVAPVLVDRNGVLNFDDAYLITGINVLDGMLMWTDDLNEPRKIDIATFKAGSNQGGNTFSVHTQVYSRDFIAEDITVIKKKPLTAPALTMRATLKTGSGLGCGVDSVQVYANFTTTTTGDAYNILETGDTKTIQFKGVPDWALNDIILFSASRENDDNFVDEYFVRAEVVNITVNPGPPPTTDITVEILSISQNLNNLDYFWDVVLEEEDPLFELKFPRFAYRWKYIDNNYSALSPFSEVAFIGNTFDYTPYKALNKGMQNYVRFLELGSFDTAPADVESIDILYKDGSSNNIYKIETIPVTDTTFEVQSNVFGPVIESNQIIRAYDNVPKKAKSQEIISNRLIYGNYVQNFNIETGGTAIIPELTTSYTATAHGGDKKPEASVKSMRNYQLGVVYADEYGRETPVFTSSDAAVDIPKVDSNKSNKLRVSITSNAPDFASHYKIMVKDTSNPYYNLALDRFYKADDGNVWLSFPSADRNKLIEDNYIHLKKAHDSDLYVEVKAKYKILDISNQAPQDVTNKLVEKQSRFVKKVAPASDDNEYITVRFNGPKAGEDADFYGQWSGRNYIKFINVNTSNPGLTGAEVTDLYEILSGGPTGEVNTVSSVEYAEYSLTFKTKKSTDFAWWDALAADTNFTILVYQYEQLFKKEYQGKFFVKINRDTYFDEYILSSLQEKNPKYDLEYTANGILNTYPAGYDSSSDPPILTWHTKPVAGSNSMVINWGYDTTPYDSGAAVGANFFYYGLAVGKYIYFPGDGEDEYYTITNISDTVNGPDVNGEYEIERVVTFDRPVTATSFSNYNIQAYRQTRDWNKYFDETSDIFVSQNPAIFETEPLEDADLDIYYEATNLLDIATHGTPFDLEWFNCYSFGNGVESNRINDDFNAPTVGKGVKVSSILEEPYVEERRDTGLIYSGIYNSISGVNNLNQFIAGLKITKDLEPIYGSIQKLHARDTSLVAFCEDKVFRILADKDALYNADGNVNLVSTNRVLGDASTFAGEYGISKNPESFASYGFRVYFTDKARGAVLRLSIDGLTDISDKSMSDFFQDGLKAQVRPLIGSYDETTSAYNITIDQEVISFKESVDGWPTRLSYLPEFGISLNNEYYTFNGGELWEHSNETRSNFYDTQYDSTVTCIINDSPSSIKNFKSLSYEGDSGWTAEVATNSQNGEVDFWKKREGIFFNYIKGLATTWNNVNQTGTLDTSEFSIQGVGSIDVSGVAGSDFTLDFVNTINTSVQIGDIAFVLDGGGNILQIGEIIAIAGNRMTVSDDYGVTQPAAGEFVFVSKSNEVNTSGIIGYYAEVKMTTASGDTKELFGVNTEAFISSE